MSSPEELARRRAGSLEALRAVSHPLRLRIYASLATGPASAAGLARVLDIEHASASYHLRVLREAGLIELDEQRRVNGGVERRYRVVDPPDEPVEDGETATTEDWVALVAALGAMLQARAAQVTAGPKWFVDIELWVDQEEVASIRHRLDDALRDLRAAAVEPGTDGAVRVSASALLFPMRAGHDVG